MQPDSRARALGRFAFHYTEMVIAMWLGMWVLASPLTWLGGWAFGSTSPGAHGTVSDVAMTASMTIGMTAAMAWRRHHREHIVRMALVMIASALVAWAARRVDIVEPAASSLLGHGLMLVLMLVVMLADVPAYTARAPLSPRVRRGATGLLAVLVAVSVPATIAITGVARRTAAAYPVAPPATGAQLAGTTKPHDSSRPTVAILLGHDGAEVADVLGPYETFSATERMNVYAVAKHRRPVTLTGGLFVMPDLTFDELDRLLGPGATPDVVVVPAMPAPGGRSAKDAIDWLERKHAGGARILGVCNGARVLAAAGLLRGRPATSHWLRLPGLRDAFPEVRWRQGLRYVDDGEVITTGGVLSGIDGSLRVIELLLGGEAAAQTARAIAWSSYTPGRSNPLPGSRLGPRDLVVALHAGFRWDRPRIGVLLTPEVGEIELASVFDPYAGQSLAADTVALSTSDSVRSRHGLTLLPRSSLGAAVSDIDRLLVPGRTASGSPELAAVIHRTGVEAHFVHTSSEFPFSSGLRSLAQTVDVPTALWAAKVLEYPVQESDLRGSGWPWTLTGIPCSISAATLGAFYALARFRLRQRRRRPPTRPSHSPKELW